MSGRNVSSTSSSSMNGGPVGSGKEEGEGGGSGDTSEKLNELLLCYFY